MNQSAVRRTPRGRLIGAALALVVLAAAMLPAGGCGVTVTQTYAVDLQFSPDSGTVAWCWGQQRVHYPPPVGLAGPDYLSGKATLRWCAADTPDRLRSLQIVSTGPVSQMDGGDFPGEFHLAFSPDSTRLLVASPVGLDVVDLADGKHRRLTARGETVSSMLWDGNEQVVYAARSGIRGDFPRISDRALWRQRVAPSVDQRRLIRRTDGVEDHPVLMTWPIEKISPDGRFAVCSLPEDSPLGSAPAEVVSLADGQARPFRPPGSPYHSTFAVAWKPDSSCFAWLEKHTRYGDNPIKAHCTYQLLLVDPDTLEVRDFTGQMTAVLAPSADRSCTVVFDFAMRWTADGEYLLVSSDTDGGGHLVRPEPWKVIPLARRFFQRVEPDWRLNKMTMLRPLQSPQWVGASGPGGWYIVHRSGAPGRLYAPRGGEASESDRSTGADPALASAGWQERAAGDEQPHVPVSGDSSSFGEGRFGLPWQLSPDARRLGHVTDAGDLEIQSFDLPPPPGGEAPAVGPGEPASPQAASGSV